MFAYFGEEVLALAEFEVNEVDVAGDDADVGAEAAFGEFFLDLVPEGDIAGGVFVGGEDEDVVIASFVDDEAASALFVGAVLPVSAGIGAEEDDHLDVVAEGADVEGDKLEFILLRLRQMG